MLKHTKNEQIETIREALGASPDFVVTDYRGLSVAQISELRKRLRETRSSLKVVKNNLALRALRATGVEGGDEYFAGPTAMAFGGDDVSAAAKVLAEYQDKTSLAIRGGFIDGSFFDAAGVIQLSKLPGRKVIYSQIAGGMVGILSRFAGDMRSVLSTFAGCLKALEEKKSAG